jgi:hypothetical protein
LQEDQIASSELLCANGRRLERLIVPIHPDDLTAVTDKLGKKERYVSATAPDIQHRHPRADPGVNEQSFRE